MTVCPILEGEDQLRLLNYQHNMISKIQHLSSLKRLIFLDLYDNQIEEISGLSSLKSLRVLMLGKNRYWKILNDTYWQINRAKPDTEQTDRYALIDLILSSILWLDLSK